MRRFDKKIAMFKVNILFEQRNIESKGVANTQSNKEINRLQLKIDNTKNMIQAHTKLGNTNKVKELQKNLTGFHIEMTELMKVYNNLAPAEKETYNDIINELGTLNEGDFSSVLNKIKGYVSKGVLTTGILAALLATPGITNAQSDAINKAANVEQVDNVGTSVEIQVTGKSSDRNISNKKAKINADRLVNMLNGNTDYEVIHSKVVSLDGDTITKLNIKLYLSNSEIKSLENVINKYDSVPFLIISK
tara:strand:+ start:7539 stop:8282 length:744 start_codon:yes stop_codon:yes gene_type:complete